MTKSVFRIGYSLLIWGIMVAATEPSSVATTITVNFSGKNATGTTFNGWFQYDQSKSKTFLHVFDFQRPTITHEVWYQIDSQTPVFGSGTNCEPFTIYTSVPNDSTFRLVTTATAQTMATIVLPSRVTFSAYFLPCCSVGTTPVFQNTGTFTLTDVPTGALIFTGSIEATSCTQSAGAISCPCPPSIVPAPTPVCYVYVCPASPPTYPVYALRPRVACCLTRLSSRCSPRARC